MWDSRVNDAKDEIQTVRYNLNQRSAARRDGADVSKFERNIRDGIREVEAAINNLQADLQIEEDRGLKRDIVRHRRDVDNLRHELRSLKTEQSRAAAAADRQNLFIASGADGATGGYQAHDPLADMNTRQLLQQHQEEEGKQDAILGELSVGVGNLKHLGRNIGDEVDLHVRLLDDMEADVDKGQRNLSKQTGRANQINRDADSVCWMYVVICLLILVLVALCIFVFT